MYCEKGFDIGRNQAEPVVLLPKMANRHGLICGATGTGKTVTLKVLAESLSDAGVPVFMTDVKGDLAGLCRPGVDSEAVRSRVAKYGLAETGFHFDSYPVRFWDVFGEGGIPLRTTVSEMGPVLLSKLLGLNATQTDILTLVFRIADEEKLLLIDSKDLRSMLRHVSENSAAYSETYGNIPKASVNAILRGVVALEARGGEQFFGEPALNLTDWFETKNGKGIIHILDSRKLMNDSSLYTAFLLWMLSELYETLPEVGDPDKPRMVLFFDEAHLIFTGLSKPLREKLEQVVRLIRSKGVGVFFITQNPGDIPSGILGQLGNKILHGLRMNTTAEERAVGVTLRSFPKNPALDYKTALAGLGTGEALVSMLDETGAPTMAKVCGILPPQSLLGPIPEEERKRMVDSDNLYLRYRDMTDRDSAYEFLERKRQVDALEAEKQVLEAEKSKADAKRKSAQEKEVRRSVRRVGSTVAGTVGREIGNTVGKSVGGSFGKRLGGNLGAALGRSILGTFLKG